MYVPSCIVQCRGGQLPSCSAVRGFGEIFGLSLRNMN